MSKKNPNGEPNRKNKTNFYVPIDGKEVYLGPDNCFIYLHQYEPHYDHIFIERETLDNNARTGLFLWREKQKRFDDMVEALRKLGTWEREGNGWANEMDKATYRKQGLIVPEFKEPELETLTPRQVNTINFMAYILLHESLNADEFNGDGDLFI